MCYLGFFFFFLIISHIDQTRLLATLNYSKLIRILILNTQNRDFECKLSRKYCIYLFSSIWTLFEEEAVSINVHLHSQKCQFKKQATHQNVLLFMDSSGVSKGLSRFIVPTCFIKRKVPLMLSVNLFQAAYLRPIHCKSGASQDAPQERC